MYTQKPFQLPFGIVTKVSAWTKAKLKNNNQLSEWKALQYFNDLMLIKATNWGGFRSEKEMEGKREKNGW